VPEDPGWRGVLFDLDGVFYVGEEVIPGAPEVLADLVERGVPHLLLTNTTSRPRSALVEKLARLGIPVEAEAILTPAVAAGDHLRARGARVVAPFLDARTAEDLGEVEPLGDDAESGADAVVVGDLGDAWDFRRLNRAFRLLMAGEAVELIALGMTRYWKAEDGLRLDTAPFVKALEHAAGVEATVVGKPAPAFFDAALARLGVDASAAIMIGDDIRTDVGGAQAAGIRGVQVRTGKFTERDLEGDVTPDAVMDSVAALPSLRLA
jgi:HAD superfamily hydrolase (TIGR01458 family)